MYARVQRQRGHMKAGHVVGIHGFNWFRRVGIHQVAAGKFAGWWRSHRLCKCWHHMSVSIFIHILIGVDLSPYFPTASPFFLFPFRDFLCCGLSVFFYLLIELKIKALDNSIWGNIWKWDEDRYILRQAKERKRKPRMIKNWNRTKKACIEEKTKLWASTKEKGTRKISENGSWSNKFNRRRSYLSRIVRSFGRWRCRTTADGKDRTGWSNGDICSLKWKHGHGITERIFRWIWKR